MCSSTFEILPSTISQASLKDEPFLARALFQEYISIRDLNKDGFLTKQVEDVVNIISKTQKVFYPNDRCIQILHDMTPDGAYSSKRLGSYMIKVPKYEQKDLPVVIRVFSSSISEIYKGFNNEDVITLILDTNKREIYRKGLKNIGIYSFQNGRNKRFERLVQIVKEKRSGSSLLGGATYQNLSSEISAINKVMAKRLNLTHDLIINNSRTGYEINFTFYKIELSS